MQNRFSSQRLACSMVLAIAIGNFPLSVRAAETTTLKSNAAPSASTAQSGTMQLAQIVGTCRTLNSDVTVYTGASPSSGSIGTLRKGVIVRLSDNGSAGFVGIDQPITGFVQARYLSPGVTCPGNTTPPTTPPATPPTTPPTTPPATPPTTPPPADAAARCRFVVNPAEGLVIRASASSTSNRVGGVGRGERVTLTTNPATRQTDSAGRNWIQISRPQAGWISNGFSNGPSNLIFCPK